MSRIFPVVIEKDSAGFFAISCPGLEGCFTQGATIDEALENIKEAIALCLEGLPEEEMKILDARTILVGHVVV